MLTEKIAVLERIYRLYGELTEPLDLACRKYCADCCTANVTMTRLEGTYILHALDPGVREKLFLDITGGWENHRFQPRLTTNGFAEYCRSNGAPPEDAAGMEGEVCPLLEEKACAIYPLRPFGCRCMISTRPCREAGEARIDPFTLTINTVFMQFIEHLDKDGSFGNLSDILFSLSPARGTRGETCRTVSCRPIPALMIPPEHRVKIRPILDALNERITGG